MENVEGVVNKFPQHFELVTDDICEGARFC